MPEKELFYNFLGHEPTEKELAKHFADRLSALEKQYKTFLFCGDKQTCTSIREQISRLQKEAKGSGFDRENYPGLFLGLPGARKDRDE
jgi:hypothetical protein